jgi:hypothetical protein
MKKYISKFVKKQQLGKIEYDNRGRVIHTSCRIVEKVGNVVKKVSVQGTYRRDK